MERLRTGPRKWPRARIWRGYLSTIDGWRVFCCIRMCRQHSYRSPSNFEDILQELKPNHTYCVVVLQAPFEIGANTLDTFCNRGQCPEQASCHHGVLGRDDRLQRAWAHDPATLSVGSNMNVGAATRLTCKFLAAYSVPRDPKQSYWFRAGHYSPAAVVALRTRSHLVLY